MVAGGATVQDILSDGVDEIEIPEGGIPGDRTGGTETEDGTGTGSDGSEDGTDETGDDSDGTEDGPVSDDSDGTGSDGSEDGTDETGDDESEDIESGDLSDYLKSPIRKAHQYSFVNGTFFWSNNPSTVRTYWNNQMIGFYYDVEPGVYELSIQAKNYGKLPKEYKNFKIKVRTDYGYETIIEIKAVENGFRWGKGRIQIDGPTNIYLIWINDMYKPERAPVEDANIEYKQIRLLKK